MLDNPIWEALGTRQARLAETAGSARWFLPEVSLLAGLREPSREAFESVASLARPGEPAGLFLERPAEPVAGWSIERAGPLLQLWHRGEALPAEPRGFVELAEPDVPEMLELARLTKPGPFSVRTRELGTYLGVRTDGKLVAMAGERLSVPGYTEISAVCTHPDHLGRGHARALMAELAARIRRRDDVPFLHVLPENTRAAELYERVGFTVRARLHYAIYRREA